MPSPAPTISVLLPTRGRPAPLVESITSLRELALDPGRLEVMVAVDFDDPDSADAATEIGADYLWVTPDRHGYHQLHLYVNHLAANASGDWLLLWNDDARMLTASWDAVVQAEDPGVLWPLSNDSAGCNTFPIWPRSWTAAMGHVSLSPHCDSWIQHIGEALGLQRRVDIEIVHQRADLTGGHDDQTRAESLAGYRTAGYHEPAMQQARQQDVITVHRHTYAQDMEVTE